MNLQDLDGPTLLCIAGVVVVLLLGIGALFRGSSGSSSKQSAGHSEDEIVIISESQSKSCPRCGNSVEPNWGDYYLCTNCGFGFTGTGRWTNGHMPKLLLEPLRIYGLIAMTMMALAAVLLVTV